MLQQEENNDEISFEINYDSNNLETNNVESDITKKTSSMKKTLLIIGAIIIVIAGFACYMFVFQPEMVKEKTPFLTNKSSNVIPSSSVMINNYQSFEMQNLMSETELLAQISADLNPRPQPIVIRPVPRIVTRGFIQTPTWVIVTATFTNEAQAIRTVALNAKNGVRKGGYFWAPDYIPGAQGNFRTYIGFFDTKEEAEMRLANEPEIAQIFPNYSIQRLQ